MKNLNFGENRNFGQKSKFLTKIEILDKNRNFGQKSKFWTKIEKFEQKSKFWTKNEILNKNRKVWTKIEILDKNQNFGQNRNFEFKSKFWTKIQKEMLKYYLWIEKSSHPEGFGSTAKAPSTELFITILEFRKPETQGWCYPRNFTSRVGHTSIEHIVQCVRKKRKNFTMKKKVFSFKTFF